jgi:hypothetical protein
MAKRKQARVARISMQKGYRPIVSFKFRELFRPRNIRRSRRRRAAFALHHHQRAARRVIGSRASSGAKHSNTKAAPMS